MKLNITSLLLAASASLASAQYKGIIFFKEHGQCPRQIESEQQTDFEYTAGSNLCIPMGYSSDNYGVGLSAALIGNNDIPPTKLGGCPTSSCNENCQTTSIKQTGNGIYLGCAQFTDAPYLYIGR
ncbi:hypothetical protein T310_5046 [Rasamsonia emersonii CBS 393.64]|uniref:Uncharacterized protein n=1 Tax=Rasamsonia emersonii (strain ATCC 16479 / CBS 393.64 / IMI 116815) TaxID=1408163 RepID=A0A0F4YSS4_RASE3|nr:hypothetical protein T310_5046 [Rasamsonia emersonii CBS 393.64]KKA20906.1 hypothetical protein T310_5046 [Rasamsonia emersonii CBS 393.64]